jgi:hypothetical protein
MNRGKKKSSSWRPVFKRDTPEEYRAKHAKAAAVTARRGCNRLGLWHACPRRLCRRAECCGGEPLQCQARSRPVIAPHRNSAPQVANMAPASPPPAVPVMSAAEAAAAIKASIAGLPPDPSAGEELVAWCCEGGIQYLPRSRLPKA